MQRRTRISYVAVLAGAVSCYAALGLVVRIVPGYVGGTLGGSSLAVGFAIGAPAVTAVLSRPLGGRLADAHGTRLVVAAGAVVMVLGALPAFAERYGWLIASRLLVGLGEGMMMSASVLWLLRLAGPERRGRALGHIGLANYAGLTLGPLLADALGGSAHPQRIFAVAAVLPLACLAVVPLAAPGAVPDGSDERRERFAAIARLTLRPGLGLLLVNVGYAALLSFGAAAVGAGSVLVLPIYAVTVIVVRTAGGGIPDRYGGRRTLILAAPLAALGLALIALLSSAGALGGVLALGVGQALAVPALGLLALERVPPAQHGAASGLFFAWFDGGVGLGGPFAGAAAAAGGADAALAAAAAAVTLAVPVAVLRGSSRRSHARSCGSERVRP